MVKIWWVGVCSFVLALVVAACGDNIGAHVSVEDDSLTVSVGETLGNAVTVIGYEARDSDRVFTVDDPSLVKVVDDGDVVWVTGRKVGSTTMRFQYGIMEKDISIEVVRQGHLGGDGLQPVGEGSDDKVLSRLELDAPSLTLPVRTHGKLTATAIYSDGTTADVSAAATWSTDDATIATSTGGDVDALVIGSTAVHVALDNATADGTIRVTGAHLQAITIDPPLATIPVGAHVQLSATAHYDDLTTLDVSEQATWSVDAHATVDATGYATGTSAGFSHVTATVGTDQAHAFLTITSAQLLRIDIDTTELSIPVGTQHQLTATAVFDDTSLLDVTSTVVWSSANPAVATVSGGLVTGKSIDDTVVTASLGVAQGQSHVTVTGSPVTSIDVSPAASTMPLLTRQQLVATAHFLDGTSADITASAVWSTSAPLIAWVGNSDAHRGEVQALLLGDATITATFGAIAGSATVHVSAAVAIQLQVNPVTLTTPLGTSQGLTATAVFSDSTTLDVTDSVLWVSGNGLVATVSQHGLVTGVGVGTASVGASYGVLGAASAVTITPATIQSLTVEPASLSLVRFNSAQLTATATYSDNSVVDVTALTTFSTSDPAVAIVSNALTHGKVTALGAGSATITAAFGGATATSSVSVTAVTLATIAATPGLVSVTRGANQQLTVTGIYSDLSTADLTATSSFVSGNPAVATVSPAGLVTGVAVGLTAITVTNGGKSTIVNVTITPAILVSVSLGNDVSLPKGLKLPLIAVGTYSDGTSADVTANATFTSSAASVASVSNVIGSVGLLSANAAGDATITATVLGIPATVHVNVSNAALTGIEITGAVDNLLLLQVEALTALGHYTDGSTQDLTSLVNWGSSNPGVLSISNLPGLQGKAIGLALGSTNITASLGTILGTKPTTVGAGCHPVINEVKTGTLLNSKDEFIEILNPCDAQFALDGQTLVYRTALGTTDTVLANLSGTLTAGQYLVFGNSGFTGTKDGSFTTDLAQLGGGIALRSSATTVVDSVGYGVSVNAYNEGLPVLAAPLGQAIARVPNGTDTNSNIADFHVQAPTPRAAN